MNCPQCSTEMVKAKATSFGEEYDYCRTCKKEHKELVRPIRLDLSGDVNLGSAWRPGDDITALEAAIKAAQTHAKTSPASGGFCADGGTYHIWSFNNDCCTACGITSYDLSKDPLYAGHSII